MNAWSPHAKFRHVFVILRLDHFHRADLPLKDKVNAVKVMWTQEAAEAEVERLNRLNSEKQCEYFWTVSRLVGDLPDSSP